MPETVPDRGDTFAPETRKARVAPAPAGVRGRGRGVSGCLFPCGLCVVADCFLRRFRE